MSKAKYYTRWVLVTALSVGVSYSILRTFVFGGPDCAYGRIVFTKYYNVGNEDVFSINLDGSDLQRLTNDDANDRMPVFSPDGSKIAYYSDTVPGGAIVVMNYDGSEKNCISTGKGDFAPAFFPDGNKIACISAKGGRRGIYVMGVHDKSRERVTPDYVDGGYFVITSDGERIIFNGNVNGEENLYKINSDGTALKRIVGYEFGLCEFAVSRTGNLIAFSLLNPGYKYILTVDSEGNFGPMLSTRESFEERPSFTPEGKRIVFQSLAISPKEGNGYSISIIDADGNRRNRLTDAAGSFYEPRVSPDGRVITYGTTDISNAKILTMNIDGSAQRFLCAGNPETVQFAPSLVDGRLLDYYGHWHNIEK